MIEISHSWASSKTSEVKPKPTSDDSTQAEAQSLSTHQAEAQSLQILSLIASLIDPRMIILGRPGISPDIPGLCCYGLLVVLSLGCSALLSRLSFVSTVLNAPTGCQRSALVGFVIHNISRMCCVLFG